MNPQINTRTIVYSAFLISIGVVLPIVFHQFGIAGRIFLPMHLPVLLAGLWMGALSGCVVGLITPIASTMLTGMPPLGYTVLMVPELAVYGLMGGVLYRSLRLNIWLSLVGAMVAGRVVFGLVAVLLAPLLGFPGRALIFVLYAFGTGGPGILIQLVFLPLIIKKLQGDQNEKVG